MFKIFLDTSDRVVTKIILFKDAEVHDCIEGEFDLVTALFELLKKHNLTVESLSDIEMFPGPGSFTGLRIGASVVNTLRWVKAGYKDIDPVLPKYQSSKFD